MLFEFAIEPSVISNWERARYFLDAIGPWKGKLLSRYPKKWKKMVYSNLSCGEIEKKRIEEKLAQLNERFFVKRKNSYSEQKRWIENAIDEHSKEPFHAIITELEDFCNEQDILFAEIVDEQCDRWRTAGGSLIVRDEVSLANSVELLIRVSKKILIIDPYFRSDQDDKTRALLPICQKVANESERLGVRKYIEIHCTNKICDASFLSDKAGRVLPAILPKGINITMKCWEHEEIGRIRHHNRYVLTEIGGVKLGDSIETGEKGQVDHLSLLDERSHEELWEAYNKKPCEFFREACQPMEIELYK